MSEAYIGEIRVFGFNFAPVGWFFCDGQTLSIAQYTALFSIIGTFYGGNGKTTFALPNFQGGSGVHQGTGTGLSTYDVGETERSIDRDADARPAADAQPRHQYPGAATATQEQRIPTAGQSFFGSSKPDDLYSTAAPSPATSFSPSAISMTGQSLPHDNMQPYQVLNFCICYNGFFPSRN